MSRAFSPPETLSNEDVRTVADVRRTVWINGLFGLAVGSLTCSLGHVVLQKLQRDYIGDIGSHAAESAVDKKLGKNVGWIHKILKPLPPLGRNTFMLSLLGGGALGSFVMSTTAGKNAVHLLHPIFQIGRDEHAGQSPYQIALKKARTDSSTQTQITEEDELDAAHHRARSLHRRASIKERLESGHSLSSTHGNTWPYEEEEMEETKRNKALNRAEEWERRQTQRREWVHDKIEKGRALSDATGGHWDEK
ncbi:hypothetical protein ACHAW6_012307 [Cyclotella cf. meneghiniana]